jgi:hypothetical protein
MQTGVTRIWARTRGALRRQFAGQISNRAHLRQLQRPVQLSIVLVQQGKRSQPMCDVRVVLGAMQLLVKSQTLQKENLVQRARVDGGPPHNVSDFYYTANTPTSVGVCGILMPSTNQLSHPFPPPKPYLVPCALVKLVE